MVLLNFNCLPLKYYSKILLQKFCYEKFAAKFLYYVDKKLFYVDRHVFGHIGYAVKHQFAARLVKFDHTCVDG